MFKKTVKKTCVQAGCPNKDQAVDLGLNVCEFDGAPLVEERVLDRRAVAFASAAGVLLMAVSGYGATIMVKRWLMTKATSAIVAQLGNIYDSSFGEQLRARAAGLVQIRGSDEETTRRIVQELQDEAEGRLGEVSAAVEALYRGTTTPPAEEDVRRILDEGARKYGLSKGTLAKVESQVRANQEEVRGYVQQAMSFAAKGDYSQAAAHLEQVARREPANAWALANLCAAYMRLGRRDDALKACDGAIRSGTQNWLAHYNMASVRVADGQKDEALQELTMALDLVERDAPSRMTRPELVRQMKEDAALSPLRKEPSFAKLTESR